ncbi:cob(I)yrinic acid a,c-diamide adenosyltransferase [Candidatus Kaiserbacteria bacterium]|nr:cob(I)yrinic acid a,c-diamide adenosyltransferase [Candidatus Kaiserbacteria bacterium]
MLYTGKGDAGTTKVFDSTKERISKSSDLPEALGALDELNAFVGFVKAYAAENARIAPILRQVQEELFIIQAEIAGADKRVNTAAMERLEQVINNVEKAIPALKGFSIAGGTELSALLDVARTLARRAERRVVALAEAGVRDVNAPTLAYLNRLSSLLFALARLANHLAGVPEENPRY